MPSATRVTPFTEAIVAVLQDSETMAKYPIGIAPVEILDEVQKANPGEFMLCTVIDVADEKEQVYAILQG